MFRNKNNSSCFFLLLMFLKRGDLVLQQEELYVSEWVPLICTKAMVSFPSKINDFLFTTHERRTTEETAADVKKNEELLDGEIEGFKYI